MCLKIFRRKHGYTIFFNDSERLTQRQHFDFTFGFFNFNHFARAEIINSDDGTINGAVGKLGSKAF